MYTREVSTGGLAATAGRRIVLLRAVSILKVRVLNPRKSAVLDKPGQLVILPAANVKA